MTVAGLYLAPFMPNQSTVFRRDHDETETEDELGQPGLQPAE
ncbi:MAG: hypothetical protein AAFQ24_10225 [Pseudomonadota bacterium]